MFGKNKNANYSETEFSCKRDGLTIRGTEYRPKSPQGEKLPVAIVSHGFMAFQDTVRHYTKAFAEMGYLSYCFDFSGGCVVKGKSDGKTTDMSVLTEVRDLEAVIEYARSQDGADTEKITLMGCSQGGFVSALAAAKPENRIHRLVLFYPALCIPDDARAGQMMFAKFDLDNIPDIVQCGPMKLGRVYVEDVIGMDPFAEISGFSGDVLIVHGDSDKVVNVSYSERAVRAYTENRTESGGTVDFKILKKAGHGFSPKEDETALEYLKNFAELIV